jgi:phosphatidate cytidylyltransferase
VGIGAALFFPLEFSPSRFSAPVSGILLGLVSGIAGTLGDLGESALKRSVGMKDSGTIMPGRGGILDTVDSIALAAPVYYGLYWLLFN